MQVGTHERAICSVGICVSLSLAYNIALKEDVSEVDRIRIQEAIKKSHIDPVKFADPDHPTFSDNGIRCRHAKQDSGSDVL